MIVTSLLPEHIMEEIRLTYPYMDKVCINCFWDSPSADLNSVDEWCRYFDKEVTMRQPACDYFINRYVQYLM